MDAHVPKCSATEVDELAPLSGVINLADVIMNGSGAHQRFQSKEPEFLIFP